MNASTVGSVSKAIKTLKNTGKFIPARNHLNAQYVANVLDSQSILLCMAEFTRERNDTNVIDVTWHLAHLEIKTDI